MPGELSKPIAPSSFYLEFDSMTDLVFKSVKLPDYKPKVQGKDSPFGSTKGGKTIRQINSSGFEGLFSFECVCVASPTGSSASKKMYSWLEQCMPASAGGKGKFTGSKKAGAITAYDNDGQEVAKWEFTDAWPSKYKCADFDAAGDTYLDETFTITCEKFNRTM
jgi:phage tail-like protein